ncbi:MAG: peptidyl-prolyl cis-trans isomerase [Blastocatellia bacterium]
MMKYRQHALLSLACFLLSWSLTGVTARAQEDTRLVDEVIARVNASMIMRSQFEVAQRDMLEEMKTRGLKDAELEKKFTEMKPGILDSLIDQQLLIQRARDLSIDVEAQVNQQLKRLMDENQIGSVDELEQKMREAGVDIQEVRRNFRNKFLTDAVLGREVYSQVYRGLTENEKRAFYDKYKDYFTVPGEVTLSRLVILAGKDPEATLVRAKELVTQARAGSVDFAALSRRYSEDPEAQKNPSLGTQKIDVLVNEVRAAVEKAPAGSVTDPVKLGEMWMIFRVDDRKEPQTRSYDEEEVKNELANRLAYEKGQGEIENYLKRLREDAFIEIDARYQLPGMKVQSASIKRVPVSDESEKERKKREKREKKEREQQEKQKAREATAKTVGGQS